jgi:hypothetical protein
MSSFAYDIFFVESLQKSQIHTGKEFFSVTIVVSSIPSPFKQL